jgi:LysM repeat protein
MKHSRSLAFLVAVTLLLGLAGCARSIPGVKKPKATGTGESQAVATLGGTSNVMDQIYLFATQTALATQGLTTGVPPAAEVTGQPYPAPGSTELAVTQAAPNPAQATPQPKPAVPALPAPTPGRPPASYTIQRGEFPYCIARRFNVDPAELLRMNGLTSTSVYYVGMVLRIPQSGHPFPGNRSLQEHPASYTVRPGDTIYSISCDFGNVDPSGIAYVNSLKPPYRLTPGDTINIP